MSTWNPFPTDGLARSAAALMCIAPCVLFSCCGSTGKPAAATETQEAGPTAAESASASVAAESVADSADASAGEISAADAENVAAEIAAQLSAEEAEADGGAGAGSAAILARHDSNARPATLGEFSDAMLERARNAFGGQAEGGLPVWLFSLDGDERYLYAVGISGQIASEQRSRDRAQVDAHRNLQDAAKILMPDVARPNVNGYTMVSAFSQKVRSPKDGRQGYVSAILIRIPRERLAGRRN